MKEHEYFAGKVRQCELPVLENPAGSEGLKVKRLLLPQGELAQFYNANEGIRYIAYIALKEGTTRANHYHKQKAEFVYVLSGEGLLVVEEIASKQRETLTLKAGNLIWVAPEIAHAFRIEKSGHAVEFSSALFDPADTYRYPLI